MSNDYRNESRRNAPLDKYGTPGTQYPTPNPYDIVITEEVTNRAQVFEPILFGTPHPTVAAAVLCYQGQVKSGNTDKAPIRIYANPRLAQEPYNLVTGDDEANNNSYPSYVRSYLLPRGYVKGTKGSALTALIGLTLVSGGTGYATGNASSGFGKIALSFSGGAGSGAAGFAEVAAGIIVAVCLTNSGTGYTSVPTVSVAGGTGASITALIQPQTALLVDEVEQQAEDPYGGYFVRVVRKWETMPGVVITTTRLDDDGMTVTVTTQRMVTGNIVTSEALAAGVWTRKWKGEGDSNFATQITEARAIPGTAIPSVRLDPDGDTATISKVRKELATITEAETINTGVWTKVESDPITELVGWEVTTTKLLPATAVTTTKIDEDGELLTISKQQCATSTLTASESAADGLWVKLEIDPISDVVANKVVTSRAYPGPAVVAKTPEDDGNVLTTTKTFKRLADITSVETMTGGVWTRTSADPISDLVGRQVTLTRAIPGNVITDKPLDDDGMTLTTTRQRVVAGSVTPADSVTGGTWTKTSEKAITDQVSWKIIESRTVPGNWVPFADYDERLGPIQGRRRVVENTGQTASLTATKKTTYEARGGSSAVVTMIERINSDGTGSAGNPAYPINDKDIYDEVRGAVQQRSQLVVRTGSEVGSLSETAGVVTEIRYEPYNEFLLTKVTETFSFPCPIVSSYRLDFDGEVVEVTKQLVAAGNMDVEEVMVSTDWVRTFKSDVNEVVSLQITETRGTGGVEKISPGYEPETGARMRTVEQLVELTTALVDRADTRSFGVTMYCVDCDIQPINSSLVGRMVTVYMELPPSRTLKGSRAFPVPAVFASLGSGWVLSGDGFSLHGPFAGVDYTATGRRTAVQSETEITYTVGQDTNPMPDIWTVVTPGDASRFFPIGANTIHNAIEIYETAGMSSQLVEDIGESTPNSYTPGQDMIADADEAPWKHSVFWERKIQTVFEPVP